MSSLVVLIAGIFTLLGTVVIVGRGIFRQVNAVQENTDAVKALTAKVEGLFKQFADHETRISVLEDRIHRP
jgi:hypothetical protein